MVSMGGLIGWLPSFRLGCCGLVSRLAVLLGLLSLVLWGCVICFPRFLLVVFLVG